MELASCLTEARDRAHRTISYIALREQHPEVPVRLLWAYTFDDAGLSLAQFLCERTTGHLWVYTGAAYGGDDDSYHGEGRCYCANCGADGDA